jgi:cytochrome c-type biogenesis protein CcmF
LFAALGMTKPLPLFVLWNCGFALWANVNEFVTPVLQRMRARKESAPVAAGRVAVRARRRFGGHIAHYGIILATFSLALSRGYRLEKDFNVPTGGTFQFQGYDITYTGSEMQKQPHRDSVLARFDVSWQGSPLGTYEPRMNYYRGTRMTDPIWTPDVRSTPVSDLYFSLIEIPPDGKSVQIKLIEQPYMMWLWWSAPIIFLGALIAAWPARAGGARATAEVPAEAQGEPA